jgi:hypothetical protein
MPLQHATEGRLHVICDRVRHLPARRSGLEHLLVPDLPQAQLVLRSSSSISPWMLASSTGLRSGSAAAICSRSFRRCIWIWKRWSSNCACKAISRAALIEPRSYSSCACCSAICTSPRCALRALLAQQVDLLQLLCRLALGLDDLLLDLLVLLALLAVTLLHERRLAIQDAERAERFCLYAASCVCNEASSCCVRVLVDPSSSSAVLLAHGDVLRGARLRECELVLPEGELLLLGEL